MKFVESANVELEAAVAAKKEGAVSNTAVALKQRTKILQVAERTPRPALHS